VKFVIFGLTISSSWGNGHATLWRGLCRSLARRGHQVVFFEQDVTYYAQHRDLWDIPGGLLVLYESWDNVRGRAEEELRGADVGMVTSYCADGIPASDLVLSSAAPVRVFYDLDTPVTLHHLQAGLDVNYLPPYGLGDFDLVLSYTGGQALEELKTRLGARLAVPLYGSVDPDLHRPVPLQEAFRGDLSYLGTYAGDRQNALERLFIEPARRMPGQRFVMGGAQYPGDFPWTSNLFFVGHLAPQDHPAFYCSSRFTLNVTRKAMADMGYCPSGRLFEAAACGSPLLSDEWEGLDQFYKPGTEIMLVRETEDVITALRVPQDEVERIARAARERTLDEHTADRRAAELEVIVEQVMQQTRRPAESEEAVSFVAM
jgi:spore maturation protein CgeB